MASSSFYFIFLACCLSFFCQAESKTLYFNVAQIFEIKAFVNTALPEICGEMPSDLVLVTAHSNFTDKYAEYQIKKVRHDPCFAHRFITIVSDVVSMENCVKREFGLCVESVFYGQHKDEFDELFNPWAMIGDLLENKINVFYSEYNVLILKNPLDKYEPKIDFIYQKAKYNTSSIVMGNSLWASNTKTVKIIRSVFDQKEDARKIEEHINIYFTNEIQKNLQELDLMPATFSFMHLSACWELNVATTTYQVKNGHSYHLDCLRDKEALEIAEVVTL